MSDPIAVADDAAMSKAEVWSYRTISFIDQGVIAC
jgi:hypothetical protein